MKKLLVTLALAGTLSVPSVVFAEATWYGSLRGGLHVGGGGDGQFFDGGSRWGIKGSAEAGDGLTAVYRFEHKISTTDGGQPGGRLAYAGLTGGFGSITLGQIWSAAYNHAGAITDKSYYFGDSAGTYRHGNALSYAFSSGALGFQLDLISDGGTNTGKAIDKTEFGMTIGLGEIGRVAIAHTNMRDQHTTSMADVVPSSVTGDDMFEVSVDDGKLKKEYGVWRDKTTGAVAKFTKLTDVKHTHGTGNSAVSVMPLVILNADGTAPTSGVLEKDDNGKYYAPSGCTTRSDCTTPVLVWVSTSYPTTGVAAGKDPEAALTVQDPGSANANLSHSAVATLPGMKRGSKNTHVAVEFSVGGFTPYVGYSKMKENGATKETKTTHYGVSGGLGDSGINYLVAARNVKDEDGKKTTPWLFNVSKSLGGGATVIFEHGNDDNNKSGKSRVGLHVTF